MYSILKTEAAQTWQLGVFPNAEHEIKGVYSEHTRRPFLPLFRSGGENKIL